MNDIQNLSKNIKLKKSSLDSQAVEELEKFDIYTLYDLQRALNERFLNNITQKYSIVEFVEKCKNDEEFLKHELYKSVDTLEEIENLNTDPISHIKIETLPLSTRAKNVLFRMGVDSLTDLGNTTQEQLLRQPQCGQGLVKELIDFINICKKDQNYFDQILIQNHLKPGLKLTIDIVTCTKSTKNNDFDELSNPDVILNNNNKNIFKNSDVILDDDTLEMLINKEYISTDDRNIDDKDTEYLPVEGRKMQRFSLFLKNELEDYLNKLDENKREILNIRLGINCETKTLEELGQIYGRTRERIRQIESKSIAKISKLMHYGYSFLLINGAADWLFKNYGALYKIKDIEDILPYSKLINALRKGFTFFIDFEYGFLAKDDKWLETLKNNIFKSIEEQNGTSITIHLAKDLLKEIIKQELQKIVFTDNEFQINNFDSIYNLLSQKFLEKYCIKISENEFQISKTSKLNKKGKVNTKERNIEIVSMFGKIYPEGVHLPIDKMALLKENLKDLTNAIPYKLSIRTLSDTILKNAKEIILWDKGVYIHVNNIHIQWSAVDEAIDTIINEFNNGFSNFSIKKIYDMNPEKYLNAGIHNPTALLGLIKYKNNPRIGNIKLEIYDIENNGDCINKTNIIEEYMQAQIGWVSVEKMQQHFCEELGWEDYQIDQYVAKMDTVKKDTNLGFAHMKYLISVLNKDVLKELLQLLYNQTDFTKEPMKLAILRKSAFAKKWNMILNADVTGPFMSDFIDSLHFKELPLIFYQGSVYNIEYESSELTASYNPKKVLKNFNDKNYNALYSNFKIFDTNLLDKILNSKIKIANVLFDKSVEPLCDYFYSCGIEELGVLLFFPFNCIAVKKRFTEFQINKTINKICTWIESFQARENETKTTSSISSLFWD